jgi:hypothetical protein
MTELTLLFLLAHLLQPLEMEEAKVEFFMVEVKLEVKVVVEAVALQIHLHPQLV